MRLLHRRVMLLLLIAGSSLAASITVACAQQPTSPNNPAAAPSPTPLVLNNAQLTAIQPALGTVMIEYSRRMASVYFAEQAGNWDMAKYQVLEMREIQEVGETTRPSRAPALKAFESGFLDPLANTIDNKDANDFTTAYSNAIGGCNGCHASQTSSEFPGSYSFIKVQVPTDSTFESLIRWK